MAEYEHRNALKGTPVGAVCEGRGCVSQVRAKHCNYHVSTYLACLPACHADNETFREMNGGKTAFSKNILTV